jgi:hypothetical protein
MNQEFVLGKLSSLMAWDEETAQREFAWLRLMSRMKYDSYQDFLAGIRFIESLAYWLQQFEPSERPAAYDFVRQGLVFIGTAEIRHLVELFFPETVQPRLLRLVAERRGIPQYRVWSDTEATRLYQTTLRKTLFIELSDGARIDIFRRSNAGIISNEQVVTTPRLIRGKWDDLLNDLRKVTGNPEERFAAVYLVDDFIGSGTTLLRNKKGTWEGKLVRFWEDVGEVAHTHFEPGWTVCVHHYVSTFRADQDVRINNLATRTERGASNWFANVEFSCGTLLPQAFPINLEAHRDLAALVQKYYDSSIETEHMKLGGDDARLGFGKCALPLVLEHNTPNNSIALLWAETAGIGAHAMRPLFRRRQRHV